ncbi:MAG: hypothetical protein WC340_17865 [Kiritimatiellia bacterium]
MSDKIAISLEELLSVMSRYGYEKDLLFKKQIFSGDRYIFLKNKYLNQSVIIPNIDEFDEGILFKIAKQAWISPDELSTVLNRYRDIFVHPVLIAYMDILGFSNLIEDTSNDNTKLNEVLNRFKDAFKPTFSVLKKSVNGNSTLEGVLDRQVRIFSDNILIYYSCYDEIKLCDDRLFDLKLDHLLNIVAEYQLNLAIRGYFSRGGIAFDEGYCDNEIIFGPALLQAVELEKNYDFPGIVLDAKIVNLIQSQRRNMGDTPFDDLLATYNGYNYVNYLYLLKDFNDSMNHVENNGILKDNWMDPKVKMALESHKTEIEKNLCRFSKEDPKILQKYLWVAHYHNEFCIKYFPNFEKNFVIYSV